MFSVWHDYHNHEGIVLLGDYDSFDDAVMVATMYEEQYGYCYVYIVYNYMSIDKQFVLPFKWWHPREEKIWKS